MANIQKSTFESFVSGGTIIGSVKESKVKVVSTERKVDGVSAPCMKVYGDIIFLCGNSEVTMNVFAYSVSSKGDATANYPKIVSLRKGVKAKITGVVFDENNYIDKDFETVKSYPRMKFFSGKINILTDEEFAIQPMKVGQAEFDCVLLKEATEDKYGRVSVVVGIPNRAIGATDGSYSLHGITLKAHGEKATEAVKLLERNLTYKLRVSALTYTIQKSGDGNGNYPEMNEFGEEQSAIEDTSNQITINEWAIVGGSTIAIDKKEADVDEIKMAIAIRKAELEQMKIKRKEYAEKNPAPLANGMAKMPVVDLEEIEAEDDLPF